MRKHSRGYLDWEGGFLKLSRCLIRDGLYKENLLVSLLCYGGLRYSDAIKVKVKDIEEDKVVIEKEKKTGKYKEFPMRKEIKQALSLFNCPHYQEYLFINKSNNKFYSIQWFNRFLHNYIEKNDIKYYGNIGSHMFRKTFGRRFIEINGNDLSVLMYLKDFLNHSNVETTYAYLGLHKEEMNKLIMNV